MMPQKKEHRCVPPEGAAEGTCIYHGVYLHCYERRLGGKRRDVLYKRQAAKDHDGMEMYV